MDKKTIMDRCLVRWGESLETQEGFRSRPYRDSQGYWTIGYGLMLGQILAPAVVTILEVGGYLMPFDSTDDGGVGILTNIHTNKYKINYIDKDTARMVANYQFKRAYQLASFEFTHARWDAMPDGQKICNADIVYNIGLAKFRHFVGFIDAMQYGRLNTACGELLISKRAGQVPQRTAYNIDLLFPNRNLDLQAVQDYTHDLLKSKYKKKKKPQSYYAGLVNKFTERYLNNRAYLGDVNND